MKVLAILRDSVREAIDFKVFYVMIGLSLVLAVLALSLGFTPVPGGDRVIRDFAVLGLYTETSSSLDQAEMLQELFGQKAVPYTVSSVKAIDGDDSPTGRFRVRLEAKVSQLDTTRNQETDDTLLAFVREHFGLLEGVWMMKATDVRLLGWEGRNVPILGRDFGNRRAVLELVAEPTPATIRFWPHRCSVFFGAFQIPGSAALFQQVVFVESFVVGALGANVAVLVSIIITAFFIPNMLRKGTVDLLLVKPLRRTALLLYKYFGGLTFIFLNTAVAVGAMWVALGLRSGLWSPTFLMMIVVLTFFFAVLYAVSTLFGVLTRSPVASILLTVGFWAVATGVTAGHAWFELWRGVSAGADQLHDQLGDEGLQALAKLEVSGGAQGRRITLEELRFHENWLTLTLRGVYKVLPRTAELYQLLNFRLQHDLAFGEAITAAKDERPPPKLPGGITLPRMTLDPPAPAETFAVSLAFIAMILGLASWRFAVRDY
jgi:ABC-type transport system involved in multi-copper enzyme maturation permease subunit